MNNIKTIRICSVSEMDIAKTFDCGQCFRWNPCEDGSYLGIAGGIPARVYYSCDDVLLDCPEDSDESFWHGYFDLDTDYAAQNSSFMVSDYMETSVLFGQGIRILRQEPWEALCSFIISQCNNIPRIKKIVETLCSLYGDEVSLGDITMRTFPDYERIALLSEEDLAPLRSGYRAPYIINAARCVVNGELNFEEIYSCSCDEALKKLMSFRGIGKKVASCAVLFGFSHMDAFPIDTWMKKALKDHFPENFDPASFGPYAGLAQQYIFFYARSTGNE